MPITIGSENPLLTAGEGMGAYAGGYAEGLTNIGNYRAQSALQAQQQQGQAFTGAFQTAYKQIGSLAENYQQQQYQTQRDITAHANAIDLVNRQTQGAASEAIYKMTGVSGADMPAYAYENGFTGPSAVPDAINSLIQKRQFAEDSTRLAAMGLQIRPPMPGEPDYAQAQQVMAGVSEAQRNPNYSVPQIEQIRSNAQAQYNALMAPAPRQRPVPAAESFDQSSVVRGGLIFTRDPKGGWTSHKPEVQTPFGAGMSGPATGPGTGSGGPMWAPGQGPGEQAMHEYGAVVPNSDGLMTFTDPKTGRVVPYGGVMENERKKAEAAAQHTQAQYKEYWDYVKEANKAATFIKGDSGLGHSQEVYDSWMKNAPPNPYAGGGYGRGMSAGPLQPGDTIPGSAAGPQSPAKPITPLPLPPDRKDWKIDEVYSIYGTPYKWNGSNMVEVK